MRVSLLSSTVVSAGMEAPVLSGDHAFSTSMPRIKNAKNYFEVIILTEHIDNNFLFKMKKNNETKSIGFFFGLFENNREKCHVTEYSVHHTSLEQIFYKFEAERGKMKNNNLEEKDMSIEVDNNKKDEIVIDDDVYNSLI